MGYINRHKVFFAVQRQVYPANFQEKTITPNNFQREITPDAGYDALSKVKLNGILVDAHTEIESQVDNDVKYQKNVPAGALQYAGLNKVGGMSYKFNQLVQNGNFINTSNWDAKSNISSFTVNNNVATIVCNGATDNTFLTQTISFKNGHKYLVRFAEKLVESVVGARVYFRIGNFASTYFVDDTISTTKKDYNNFITFNETSGSYVIEIGMRNTQANAMTYTLEGVCIFDLTDMYGAGNEPTTVEQFKATFNKDYYDYTSGSLHHSPVTSIVSNETLNIPAQVQLLSGYGMGVNADCYNYIDFESKKFIQKVGIVDLGTLDWTKVSGKNNIFRVMSTPKSKRPINSSTLIKAVCSKYEIITFNILWAESKNGLAQPYDDDFIYIEDYNYTDATTFKSAMSGVYLVYELATPVETDISEYITQDTLDIINTITFNNEYEQAVPSEINYLIEV